MNTPVATMPDGLVWVPNPEHSRYDPDIQLVIDWCTRQGLDARAMPWPDGLSIRLESPDGGLVARVVEVVFQGDDPLRGVVRLPDGRPVRRPARTVPVDSIHAGGGLVPRWASTASSKETT